MLKDPTSQPSWDTHRHCHHLHSNSIRLLLPGLHPLPLLLVTSRCLLPMEYLLGTILVFGHLKAIFFRDGTKMSSSPLMTTFSSSIGIDKSSPSVMTGKGTGQSMKSTNPPLRMTSLASSPASMSVSIALDISTKYGSTTMINYETTESHKPNFSLNDDEDDELDFSPSIPRCCGMDLYSDSFNFPEKFAYIPLVTKPASLEVVRPSHRHYKVGLCKRHRHAPDLCIPITILEVSSSCESLDL